MKFTHTAVLAALLATGSAQAQLKAPPDVSGPVIVTPAPGKSQAPAQAPNVAQPNIPIPFTKEFQTCIQKLQESMQVKKAEDPAGAKVCFNAETPRQDAKLSANMQALLKLVNPSEKKYLEESAAAWRRLRNAECSFYSDPAGSVGESASNAECVMNRTVGRALEIDALKAAYLERENQRKAAAARPPAAAPAPAAPAAK